MRSSRDPLEAADEQVEHAGPRIVIVDSSGRGNFCSLAEAIEKAAPGDRLVVRPGVYRERLLLDRDVTLVGEGDVGEIVIQALAAPTLVLAGGQVNLRGVTLRGIGGDGSEPTVLVAGGRLLL